MFGEFVTLENRIQVAEMKISIKHRRKYGTEGEKHFCLFFFFLRRRKWTRKFVKKKIYVEMFATECRFNQTV